MAISFVTSGEAAVINGGDPALTLGATPAANDLILVAGGIGDNDDVDFTMSMITAGYTLVPGTDLFSNDVRDASLGVFYKFADGVENAATFNGQGAGDAACAATALVFRGVDTTTPFDVTSTTATGINSHNPDPPSIDWSTSGTWTVIAGVSANASTVFTYTFPTGYTTNAVDIGIQDTTSVTVGMGYKTSPADPEDPGVMTHGGSDSVDYAWCAVTMALREAVTATGKIVGVMVTGV